MIFETSSNAYVWNIIQNALENTGFLVANVSSLDKKQGGMATIRSKIAVLKDLVISAYKPNHELEGRFQLTSNDDQLVWEFIRQHLTNIPTFKRQGQSLQFVPERDPRILFDQMIAFFVRKGFQIPVSSEEFQRGLAQRFVCRDNMYFLPEQAVEYDRKRIISQYPTQGALFVTGEASAIEWLHQIIRNKPQTFQELNPLFMQQLGGWNKHETPLDLRELLEQNFVRYEGKEDVPSQIHSYLSSNFKELRNLPKDDPNLQEKAKERWYVPDPNKASDLEKIKERTLLRDFENYRLTTQKKLKTFRNEAVRVGFKKAWQEKDYQAIVDVANKISESDIQEDQQLLLYYDQALNKLSKQPL